MERQDANTIAYNTDASAKQLLSGAIPPPYWAHPLIQTLQDCIGVQTAPWMREDRSEETYGSRPINDREYSFTGIGSAPPTLKNKKSSSLASSIIPGKLRKSESVKDGSRADSPFSETYNTPSANPFGTNVAKPQPSRHVVPYDAFADDDAELWGVAAPDNRSRGLSAPLVPNNNTLGFATHFESDFDATYSTPRSNSRPSPQERSVASPSDPFPDLTTSMNAFSFSSDAPSLKQKKDGTRSISPIHHSPSPHGWADKPMYRQGPRSSTTSSSHRSDSPPTPTSSAASHKPVTSKAPRKLSLREGLDRPAPAGTIKAVALFDYNAAEVSVAALRLRGAVS